MASGTIRRTTEPAPEPSPDLFPGEAEPPDAEGASPDGRPDEFAAAHGEPLAHALDLETWKQGPDFEGFYDRLKREVAQAVEHENGIQAAIRRDLFPKLRFRPDAPAEAGVWRAAPERIAEVHRKVLFNGGVEACDGTVASHDTIPVTITQVGVCLVSYRGNEGTWGHRLFRRDLRERVADPVEEMLSVLERRQDRDRGRRGPRPADNLSVLARRGIMAYAERAALLERSAAPWRMGHGNPCPHELLTGSGLPELLRRGLDLMRRLVDHERFVFVPSEPADRWWVSLGHALRPLEYAIVDDLTTKFAGIAGPPGGGYRDDFGGELAEAALDFAEVYGPKVVVGLYRVSRYAPAQVFYAHRDHAHQAALIAMADSVLQEHRGFPLLIDLADGICAATYGGGPFHAAARMAYAEAGEPFRYFGERQTRR